MDDQRERIVKHLWAKMQDQEFGAQLAKSTELMRDIPELKYVAALVCAKQEIEINDDADRLARFSFILGFALGRDFGNAEMMKLQIGEEVQP